jgi:hypothetical protein
MKHLLVLSLFLLSFCASTKTGAQSRQDKFDYRKMYESVIEEYGFDQVLFNGVIFEDEYLKKVGHQFFPDDKLYTGTLMYRGTEYKRIEMKYDICNQQLILYLKHNYLTVGIVPSNDFIATFSLGDKIFSKYCFEGEPRFYEVVFDSDKLECLYYWSKKVQGIPGSGVLNYYHYEFTDSKRKCYLKLNGSFEKYSNNRSFTDLFPPETRNMIRQYIITNHIKVAKSSDERITGLLTYCNSLL